MARITGIKTGKLEMIKHLKIEDRLWSFTYGWVSITEISEDVCEYPIEACKEGTFDYVTFTSTGAALKGGNQDLFWDEIKFDTPEKPIPNSSGVVSTNLQQEAFHLLGKVCSELSLIKRSCTCGATNNIQ